MKVIISTVVAVMMASMMIFIRMRGAKKPVSIKKIVLPPLFMSTGSFMYLSPKFQLTSSEIIEAVSVGLIFSIFLIKSSKFEIKKKDIYLKPSKAFVFILIGLLILRTILKLIIGQTISLGQTSGMFFLLAFSMIVSWRIAMFRQYKKLEKELNGTRTIKQLLNE